MDRPHASSRVRDLRAVVNTPRASVVAIVGSLCATGGAVAGAVAALIAATVLTPSEPVTVAKIVMMALSYGLGAGIAGAVLGTAVGFGALRRVPLGRLILCTNVGLAAGLTIGWLGGPWAWHHMEWLGLFGFGLGALTADLITRRSPAPPSLPTGSTTAIGQQGTLGLTATLPQPVAIHRTSPAAVRRVDRGTPSQ